MIIQNLIALFLGKMLIKFVIQEGFYQNLKSYIEILEEI